MKKALDLSRVMTEFDGKPIKEQVEVGEGDKVKLEFKDIQLKDALLGYLRRADRMGLNDPEQTIAYTLGFILVKLESEIELTTAQYDVLKKLADGGQVTIPNGEKQPVYGFVLRNQVKEAVDEAKNVEELPAQPEASKE